MKILIVEDNVQLAETLKNGLKLRGKEASCISEISDLQKLIPQISEYDLLILDLLINGKTSGESLLHLIRKKGIKVPVLILSGNSDSKKKCEMINAGADDYLVKPFHFAELEARIQAISRRCTQTNHGNLEELCGYKFYWRENRLINKKQENVSLTQKEKELLQLLVLNANEIVTNEDILKKIWNLSSAHHSNVLQSTIRRLRKKFSERPEIIQNIRGVGYKLQH